MVDLGMPTDFSNEKKKCQYELSISAVLEGCHRCHVAWSHEIGEFLLKCRLHLNIFFYLRIWLRRWLATKLSRISCWRLKGVCHEILKLHFFHDSNPSDKQAQLFCNSVLISPRHSITKFDTNLFFQVRCVHLPHLKDFSRLSLKKQPETSEILYSDSPVCSLTLLCDECHGAWRRGMMNTAKFDSFFFNSNVSAKSN